MPGCPDLHLNINCKDSMNWMKCCNGTNCCNSSSTVTYGAPVAMPQRTRSTFTRRESFQMGHVPHERFEEWVSNEPSADAGGAGASYVPLIQKNNRELFEFFKSKTSIPENAVIAVVQQVPTLEDWGPESSDCIVRASQSRQILDSFRNYENVCGDLRIAIMQKQLQEAVSDGTSVASVSGRPARVKVGKKASRITVESGKDKKFEKDSLARDIARVVDFRVHASGYFPSTPPDLAQDIRESLVRTGAERRVDAGRIWEVFVSRVKHFGLGVQEDLLNHFTAKNGYNPEVLEGNSIKALSVEAWNGVFRRDFREAQEPASGAFDFGDWESVL